ncbi:uncharacterized protein LOC143471347 isoform X3 [Clavelina lepadiformis]|uniref:uncharacterized protein LOC143471347 isoform X3 n=1 Tax=Clavelina lepadiformis TaxID=159417 RepID=UPI004041915E
MDDSMDAFQSLTLGSKRIIPLSRLRRKKRFAPSLSESEDNKISTKIVDDSAEELPLLVEDKNVGLEIEPNDTLYKISDLPDDTNDSANVRKSYELQAASNSNANDKDKEANHTTGARCAVCEQLIPAQECSSHYMDCLRKNFSSKQDMKLRLCDRVRCTTCGEEVEVSKYEVHREDCCTLNMQTARKMYMETVTSSYFGKEKSSQSNQRSKSSKCFCPSCNKNLSSFDSPSRRYHVNRCLDEIPRPIATTRSVAHDSNENRDENGDDASGVVCSQCKKSFKSKRGLSMHLRKCPGTVTEVRKTNAKRKKKIRTPRNPYDELVQGLSASEMETKKAKKREDKRKKKEIPIPAMLLESPSSRKAALEAKLALMIDKSSKNDDVPSTPSLPETSSNISGVSRKILSNWSGQVDVHDHLSEDHDKESDLDHDTEATNSSKVKSSFPTSKYDEASASKWGLTTDQNCLNSSYRAHGLLTQFQTPSVKPNSDRNAEKIDIDVPLPCKSFRDSEENNFTDSVVVVDDETICPTLQILMDLNESAKSSNGKAENLKNPSPPGSTNTYFVADCNPEKVEEIEENSLFCLPPLAESFKTLIGNQSYSDMVVEFAEESQTDRDTLHLHKCVLHCRCPQLLEVLKKSRMDNGIYQVSCCTREEFMPLLSYLYTGQVMDADNVTCTSAKLGINLSTCMKLSPAKDEAENADLERNVSSFESVSFTLKLDSDISQPFVSDNSGNFNTTAFPTEVTPPVPDQVGPVSDHRLTSPEPNAMEGGCVENPFYLEEDSFPIESGVESLRPRSSAQPSSSSKRFVAESSVVDVAEELEEESGTEFISLTEETDEREFTPFFTHTPTPTVKVTSIRELSDEDTDKQELIIGSSDVEPRSPLSFSSDDDLFALETPNSSQKTPHQLASSFINRSLSGPTEESASDDTKSGLFTDNFQERNETTTNGACHQDEGNRRLSNYLNELPNDCVLEVPKNISDKKRKSIIMTPTFPSRQKCMRMNGSTPEIQTEFIPDRGFDSPYSNKDVSAIAFSPVSEKGSQGSYLAVPPLFNLDSPTAQGSGEENENTDDNVEIYDLTMDDDRDNYDATFDRRSLSQPANNTPRDDADELFGSCTQPGPRTYKFRAIQDPISPSQCAESWDPEFSTNDSVLLAAALGLDKTEAQKPSIEAPPENFKTPLRTSRQKSKSGMVPITPAPNLSDLDTPEILKRGQRIGLKNIGKKKLKTKLREMHAYSHQLESSEEDSPVKSKPTTENKASSGTKELTICDQSSQPRSPEESSDSDCDLIDALFPVREGVEVIGIPSSENEGSDVEQLHMTIFGGAAAEACDVTSDSESERSGHKDRKKKIKDEEDMDRLMYGAITKDEALYNDILQYKPIYLSRFKELMKNENFTCKADALVDYLDRQGITFSTANERKTQRRRPRKRAKKKLPNPTQV